MPTPGPRVGKPTERPAEVTPGIALELFQELPVKTNYLLRRLESRVGNRQTKVEDMVGTHAQVHLR